MFKKVDNQDIIEEELADGTIKRYVKGKLLGKGGFAKCYQFTSLQTEKKYAAKVIDKSSLQKLKAKQKLSSEIKIHKSLSHQYVVGFQHFFEDKEYVYILLEKCSNQTLNQILKRRKRLTDIETKYYIRQLSCALQYIHREMVIHRDLKLGNLFLSDKLEIKIGDFGLATKLSHEGDRRKTKCGTPNYIAPEILDDNKTHSYEVDIWSLGVITYTLLVGRPPFQSNDLKTTYNRIKTCNYIFPQSNNLSQISKNFISKMLQLDPSKRPTIEEVLMDPFLNKNSIPQSLPLSTLACPPSLDFLRKYRQAQESFKRDESTLNNNNSLVCAQEDSKQVIVQTRQKSSKMQEKKARGTRFESVNKPTGSMNRVFSAANLNTNNKNNKNRTNISNLQKDALKIWVTYYEENPKFGLGYLLNSNVCGFRYNDATSMITNNKQTYIKLSECGRKYINSDEKNEKIMTIKDAQTNEYKKYKILMHFDRELKKTKTIKQSQMSNNSRIKLENMKFRQTEQTQMKSYVMRYHLTNKSIIFWFSTRAYQIIFEDRSQILISQKGIVTYVNKFGERVYFQDKDREKQPQQIKKRYRHLYCVIEGRVNIKKSTNINIRTNKTLLNQNEENKKSPRISSTGFLKKQQSSTKSLTKKIVTSNSLKNSASYKILKENN